MSNSSQDTLGNSQQPESVSQKSAAAAPDASRTIGETPQDGTAPDAPCRIHTLRRYQDLTKEQWLSAVAIVEAENSVLFSDVIADDAEFALFQTMAASAFGTKPEGCCEAGKGVFPLCRIIQALRKSYSGSCKQPRCLRIPLHDLSAVAERVRSLRGSTGHGTPQTLN